MNTDTAIAVTLVSFFLVMGGLLYTGITASKDTERACIQGAPKDASYPESVRICKGLR